MILQTYGLVLGSHLLLGSFIGQCSTLAPTPHLHRQRSHLARQVALHLHREMEQAETVRQLLTVDIGARAGAEPQAEVHIVDNEAVATGVCVQDVCLPSTGTNVNQGLPARLRRGGDPLVFTRGVDSLEG